MFVELEAELVLPPFPPPPLLVVLLSRTGVPGTRVWLIINEGMSRTKSRTKNTAELRVSAKGDIHASVLIVLSWLGHGVKGCGSKNGKVRSRVPAVSSTTAEKGCTVSKNS